MDYSDLVAKAIERTQGNIEKYCNKEFWLFNYDVLYNTAKGYVELRKAFIDKEDLRGAFEKRYFKFYVMRFVSTRVYTD